MKPDRDTLDKTLYQHLGLFGASAGQLHASRERVRERLHARAETQLSRAARDVRTQGRKTARYSWGLTASLAAAATIVVLVTTVRWPGRENLATVDAEGGSVYSLDGGTREVLGQGGPIEANEIVRSDSGSGAMLVLTDGSRVEMRSQSELSLDRAEDGISIHLRTGGIIVNAAKQRSGHLYVRTKDVTVSVVGTVFLVNAEDDGSRVGVIEGEVRVREGTLETRLQPGQQVSTSRAVATRPLKEEITWSRHAKAHLAILEAFTRSFGDTSGPLRPLADAAAPVRAAARQTGAASASQTFEEASIKECDPDNLQPVPDGARGGGANSFRMTPGRTFALCMTLATLVRTAYGYGPAELDFLIGGRGFGPGGEGLGLENVYGLGIEDGRRVRGGPDWVRKEHYTIEAVAGRPADAETMRGPMLRALLEKRFALKAHIETEQVPAFALTVARRGLKIKPADAGSCEPGPPRDVPAIRIAVRFEAVRRGEKPSCGVTVQANGPNQVLVGGEATLATLAQRLGNPLGRVRVFDKTEIADKFNFVLEFAWDENTPGQRLVTPDAGEPPDVPRAATIFTALDEQLGLRLEPARAPREFIVIDYVERPSPN